MIHDDIIYGRQALRLGEPYIVPESLTYLKSIARPTWAVFEWGAGGSTVWFAKKCSVVTSIEHSQDWTARVKRMLRDHNLANASVQYVPIRPDDTANPDAILKYHDKTFDMVFVDGEVKVRDRCLDNSWSKVVDGGYLMLDNSNWWDGEVPEGWSRVDFKEVGLRWIGVKEPFSWWTSVFRKPQ